MKAILCGKRVVGCHGAARKPTAGGGDTLLQCREASGKTADRYLHLKM